MCDSEKVLFSRVQHQITGPWLCLQHCLLPSQELMIVEGNLARNCSCRVRVDLSWKNCSCSVTLVRSHQHEVYAQTFHLSLNQCFSTGSLATPRRPCFRSLLRGLWGSPSSSVRNTALNYWQQRAGY